ncbi:VOC family protein [filamentous cyanobacterium LEGE 11480]|uniref:VOC family protein n=1 Tax=Romeriopsis navalis LEGE 11480 TaxID=2777977 RepID=A0A928VUU2_9CYAN|nr:VOC family protein [Romeriopsis navalis]MBE9032932.1 VOC family protein [Romeriopsis navalis LEGE 11480]
MTQTMTRNWPLNAVRIFVTDIRQAQDFYCNTLGWEATAIEPSGSFLLFKVGGVDLVVENVKGDIQAEQNLVGRFTGVSFTVEDIQATYEALSAKGVEFVQTPEKQAWGGTIASFVDHDRNGITLVSGVQ